MAKKKSLSDVLLSLPWIVRVLIAIFADCVYGVARFADGIVQRKVFKAVVGFVWIFYGLAIGWILDIVCTILNIRPILM